MKKPFKKRKPYIALIIIFVLTAVAGFFILPKATEEPDNNKDIITVSTLKEIINVSELSTFTSVYNGVAQVMNEKNQINYYVSYEATVKAGIDFDKIIIYIDEPNKIINITMPPAHITEINVDIASLDYIFINNNANTTSVSQEAYKACEADVQKESKQQEEIFRLATENAKNTLTALIDPIIEQLYADYTLKIYIFGGQP